MPSHDAATGDRCECGAAADDINFDRSLCGMCDAMHYFCNGCGRQVDECQPRQKSPAASVRVESSRTLVDQMIAAMEEAAEIAEEVGAVDTHIELCELINDAKENRVRFF